jgi:hypothetical protein
MFKEISLLVILQKERGVIGKKYMLNEHRKNNKYAPIKEHRKKVKHDPLQNKSKWRISKQGVFRKTQKYSRHLHISIRLHD